MVPLGNLARVRRSSACRVAVGATRERAVTCPLASRACARLHGRIPRSGAPAPRSSAPSFRDLAIALSAHSLAISVAGAAAALDGAPELAQPRLVYAERVEMPNGIGQILDVRPARAAAGSNRLRDVIELEPPRIVLV
jgi:hypothetical protein